MQGSRPPTVPIHCFLNITISLVEKVTLVGCTVVPVPPEPEQVIKINQSVCRAPGVSLILHVCSLQLVIGLPAILNSI